MHERMNCDASALITAQQAQMQRFEAYLGQMARILDAQQRSIDALEKDNAMRITINHQQAKALQACVRERAAALCAKYSLDERAHAAAFRSAIKKAVLGDYGIRDLHDLPLGCFTEARERIAAWSSYALVRKRREIDAGKAKEGAAWDS